MRIRFFLAFVATVTSLGLATSSASPSGPDTVAPQDQLGAITCSEGKSATWSRQPQSTSSVASTNIDVTYYHLDLQIDMVAHVINGVVRVEGTVVGSAMSMLVLDLASAMTVSSVKLPDATPLAFSHIGAELQIALSSQVSVGGTVEVDVEYSGTPFGTGFGSFVFGSRGGKRHAWSLSEPYGSRDWWPCKDHPSDKADSVRITVTVPSLYRVGSQGTLVGETVAGGNTTYDWLCEYPISSYLVSVAVGEYVQYDNSYIRPPTLSSMYGALTMPLVDLVYDDGSSALPSGWANVADVLEVFEEQFGPYPFANEKYGHAECTFGGGMEHQTMSSMGGSSFGLVAHELAHQWYGDNITLETWPHLWLNEGFATYGELVYWENRSGIYPGTFETVLGNTYNSALTATGTLVLEDTSGVGPMFSYSRVYAKGAIVLRMLRHVVGDAVFADILRAYTADPAVQYGVATTPDFQRVAENLSGMDLSPFFSQWVTDGTGYPTYEMSWAWQPMLNDYGVWVTVKQTQTSPQSNVDVFDMPLVVAVQTTSGEERFRVDNNERTQMFGLSVSSQPVAVLLDPDKSVLRGNIIAAGVGHIPTPASLTIQALLPNPTRNSLRVRFTGGSASDAEIDVYDVSGRRVLSHAVSSEPVGIRFETLDTSSLAAGVYFLRLKTFESQVTRKFVVVR